MGKDLLESINKLILGSFLADYLNIAYNFFIYFKTNCRKIILYFKKFNLLFYCLNFN